MIAVPCLPDRHACADSCSDFSSQWRYLFLLSTLTVELHLTLRGHNPTSLLATLFPSRLPYEHVALVRQAFLSASMALSQLGPLLAPPNEEEADADPLARVQREAARLGPSLQRLAEAVRAAEGEVRGMQEMELRPLAGEGKGKGQVVEVVKGAMERTFEDLQVKGAPETKGKWVGAVQRARAREGVKKGEELPTMVEVEDVKVKLEEVEPIGVSAVEAVESGTQVGKEERGAAEVAEAAGRLPTPPPDV